MEYQFTAESFARFGLMLVIEDYQYKQEYVVFSFGGSESLARIFKHPELESYRFTIGGQYFSIQKEELLKLAENAPVHYYEQRSLIKLDRDRPIESGYMATK